MRCSHCNKEMGLNEGHYHPNIGPIHTTMECMGANMKFDPNREITVTQEEWWKWLRAERVKANEAGQNPPYWVGEDEVEDERTVPFDWQPFNNYDYQAANEILQSYGEINFVEHNELDHLYESASYVWEHTLNLTQAAGSGVETRDGVEAAEHAMGVAEDMIRAWTLQLNLCKQILEQERGE